MIRRHGTPLSRLATARGFTLIELMIVVAIISILATIAISNFSRFQARARQSEAKINLKGLFEAAKAHFAESARFECGFCGWSPDIPHVYHYFASPDHAVFSSRPGCKSTDVGVTAGQQDPGSSGEGTDGSFTATATGNVDSDPYCDGWYINNHNNLENSRSDLDN